MKKKIALFLALAVTMAALSSCAALPLVEMAFSGEPSSDSGTTAASGSADSGIVIAGASDSTAADDSSDTVTISREEYERYHKLDLILDVLDNVEAYYYEDLDETQLIYGAAEGLLEATGDYYTFFYTPEAYAELWEDDEGEYAGVGMQITANYETQICTISRVFEGSPAEAAGVKRGDILYRVGEDLYVTADNLSDAVDLIRGTPGTTVDVTFLRNSEELTLTLTRATINTPRVSSMMLEDGVGLIKLYEFAGDCATEFSNALSALVEQGAKGIILDLRDNPGGWLDDAESIASLFVDEGVLCTVRYGDGTEYEYRTTAGKTDVQLVILVNESSASASEVLTGCLHDRADATVVGVTSYGKGIVQSVIPLDNGAGMQVTIAQYFTPNGNAVHKIGITPDVVSELPEGDNGDYDFGDANDPQLATALEVMREKLASKE